MTKFNAFVATAVAAVFVSGGAMAAALQPAAGEAPFMHEIAIRTNPTLTRAAVEAQAVQHMPADGQYSAQRAAPAAPSTLTRSEVEGQVARDARRTHKFPDASGVAPAGLAR